MKVKYIPVFTDNIDEQLNFFTCNLGLKVSENRLIYEDVECKTIETGSPGAFFVLVKRKALHNVKNCIILNTDDCLNDYHRLKTNGVVFSADPQYSSIGLAAYFSDRCGNKFLLLEERNYDELNP
jgi:predicted enzyme related to lactoylglutathione lyase